MRDAGIYECQVNTVPKISMSYYLTVVGKQMYFFFKKLVSCDWVCVLLSQDEINKVQDNYFGVMKENLRMRHKFKLNIWYKIIPIITFLKKCIISLYKFKYFCLSHVKRTFNLKIIEIS